jgi:hypothetical protein
MLPHLLLIIDHKAYVVIAPFEAALLSKLAYMAPPRSPLLEVVVQLKSGHCDPSEANNIIDNLLHMPLH